MSRKILKSLTSSLSDLEKDFDAAKLERAITVLSQAKRLDCYGVGMTSSFIAHDAQSRFFRLGLTANAYFDAHLQLISAASLTANDALLAISHVGRMPSLLEAVEIAREGGATVISFTQPESPLAKLSDIPFTVNVPEDAVVRVGTSAYLAHMALLEILMSGTALKIGPPAIEPLRKFHAILHERGVDLDQHPVIKMAWSPAELSSLNQQSNQYKANNHE